MTWVYNFFPSLSGGEYIFATMRVDPWTFEPMRGGMEITPLRAFAHNVPRYYIQNFGSAVSHPDTNEYSVFLQDSVRVTTRLALNLGLRYDLQDFSGQGLQSNTLWPASGNLAHDTNNVAPRIGLAYSIGDDRPLVFRAGYGWFYTRIPQIFTSAVATGNGLVKNHLLLDNTDFYDHRVFPAYPNPLAGCLMTAPVCVPPDTVTSLLTSDVSAFADNFQTPKVQQASLGIEREIAHRMAAGVNYLYVRGEHLIRTRDVNLPPPVDVTYPVYDESGVNLLGMYDVASFSTWQLSQSLTCPFPPCINPLARPIPQLGAINVFESAATSIYHGFTASIRRRMTRGLYFRLGYTFAHAIDDGQNALATDSSTVQNSYAPTAERGPSVTDQRHRLIFSGVAEPRPFHRGHDSLAMLFNDWRLSGVFTFGSGRPVNARVLGDPNRDGNDLNDRLPGYGRNAFVGPDYATTDVRAARQLRIGPRLKAELLVEAFNVMNRTNKRVEISDDAFLNTAAQFVQMDNRVGFNYFPASYQRPTNFLAATNAYAPRQVQVAVKLIF